MLDINKMIMNAMKSGDKVASETYKMIKAKILEFQKQKNAPAYTEETEVNLLQKMIKERQDAAKMYVQGNRPDLADKELAEVKVINSLLPSQPTSEEVKSYLNATYPDGVEKKNMGVVIKEIKTKFLGADGAMVAAMVKSVLKN